MSAATLPSTRNNPTTERRVRSAARRKGIVTRANVSAFFEHGHWWVENLRTGAQWSVVDCQSQTGEDYFDFEQVTEGDEDAR